MKKSYNLRYTASFSFIILGLITCFINIFADMAALVLVYSLSMLIGGSLLLFFPEKYYSDKDLDYISNKVNL